MGRRLVGGVTLGFAAGALASAALFGCDRRAESEPKAGQVSGPINPAPVASGAPDSFAPIIRRVSPAVVSIDTVSVAGRGPVLGLGNGQVLVPVRRGAGSGFLISADGYVVTNNHVIEGAQEIVVTLADERQFPARLVGRDPPTDLAVLKIDGQGLPYVSFARAALPAVGDWVIAVGNPFGLGGTATAGIVSAHARDIGEPFVTYLQIDAPINSGNSGGPSFDLQGRVVGVNTAIFSPTGASVGIGFAIPAEVADEVSRQLIQNGRVVRGYLGVGVQDLTPALAARLGLRGQRGAVIAAVEPGGPAAGALQPGDVVTAINGRAVISPAELMRGVAAARPGSELRLQVVRDGRRIDVTARAGRRPDEA